MYRRLLKAKKGDTYLISKENSTTPPDIYVASSQLNDARKLTDLQAQEKKLHFGYWCASR